MPGVCKLPDVVRCYIERAEFLQILSWIACAWGVLIVALLLATRHIHRLWIAGGVALVLLPVPWLLTVETPHGGINGFGALLGWLWGIAAASAAWVAARADRKRRGEPSSLLVRRATTFAIAIAILSPASAPLIGAVARDRVADRLPSQLPSDQPQPAPPRVPSTAP